MPSVFDGLADKLQHGARAVQAKPAAALVEEAREGVLLLDGRAHVAGVGEQQPRLGNRLDIPVVFGHPHDHVLVFGQQREQFEPGEVGVVDTWRCR